MVSENGFNLKYWVIIIKSICHNIIFEMSGLKYIIDGNITIACNCVFLSNIQLRVCSSEGAFAFADWLRSNAGIIIPDKIIFLENIIRSINLNSILNRIRCI